MRGYGIVRGFSAAGARMVTASVRCVTVLPRGMNRFESPSSSSPPSSRFDAAAASGYAAAVTDAEAPRGRSASHSDVDVPPSVSISKEARPHKQNSPQQALPPWPADAFEFNALAVDGGHGERDRHTALGFPDTVDRNAEDVDSVLSSPSVPKTVPLSEEVLERLRKEEDAPAAQAALAVGGWVCAGCWTVQDSDVVQGGVAAVRALSARLRQQASKNTSTALEEAAEVLFPRTVCPACHTLRHDALSWPWLSTVRASDKTWMCDQCGEVNKNCILNATHARHNTSQLTEGANGTCKNGSRSSSSEEEGDGGSSSRCRCCAAPRSSTPTAQYVHTRSRFSVADEVASADVGHIIVTRNRTTRWRCGDCGEVNSLQMAQCRNCARERFALAISCSQCQAVREINNALVYALDTPLASASTSQKRTAENSEFGAQDGISKPVFAPSNCYHVGSTQLDCLQCGAPLHGSTVKSVVYGAAPWWCACGVLNPSVAYSCVRCRFPRVLSSVAFLQSILRSSVAAAQDPHKRSPAPVFDFANCTSWLCDSCDGVNRASFQAITGGGQRDGDRDHWAADPRPKQRRWVDVGDVACRHCSAPWHHQLLQGGECWRCSCHAVNKRSSATCASCGMPGCDDLPAVVISAWSRGDWRCAVCGTHCYRDRLRCRCGADRPAAAATASPPLSQG